MFIRQLNHVVALAREQHFGRAAAGDQGLERDGGHRLNHRLGSRAGSGADAQCRHAVAAMATEEE